MKNVSLYILLTIVLSSWLASCTSIINLQKDEPFVLNEEAKLYLKKEVTERHHKDDNYFEIDSAYTDNDSLHFYPVIYDGGIKLSSKHVYAKSHLKEIIVTGHFKGFLHGAGWGALIGLGLGVYWEATNVGDEARIGMTIFPPFFALLGGIPGFLFGHKTIYQFVAQNSLNKKN